MEFFVMRLFRYEVEVNIDHVETTESFSTQFRFESPVQHSVGDSVFIEDQDCIVDSIVWFLDDPGSAFISVRAEWGFESSKEADTWFAAIKSKYA
jgi:hypothetical protein